VSEARPFYPFVEEPAHGQGPSLDTDAKLEPKYPARIAVYDDRSAAPRVVVIDPKDVRSYLEEITTTVVRLAKEQGSAIPFMVIREVVENFIHAYFRQPTISILDEGNLIRFSDQGPGIKEKDLALKYGTTSATEEMKQYIRGVGSGLPYVQQYMEDKGGSLTIEDNIAGGTIVTIRAKAQVAGMLSQQAPGTPTMGTPPTASYPAQAGYPGQMAAQVPAWQAMPYQAQVAQGNPYPQPYQQPSPVPSWSQGQPQTLPYASQMTAQQQQLPYQGAPSRTGQAPMPPGSALPISERGRTILAYLSTHEVVGPTELTRQFGHSQPTWSRELQALEEMGLIGKHRGGQKRSLTPAGRAYLSGIVQG